MSCKYILTEIHDAAGLARRNRPTVRNALCAALIDQLGAGLDEFAADGNIGLADQVAKRRLVLMGSIIVRRAMAQCPIATRDACRRHHGLNIQDALQAKCGMTAASPARTIQPSRTGSSGAPTRGTWMV